MLIDTHCHLSCEDEVIKDMDVIMVASGCDDKTNKDVLELIKKFDNVYGTLGIHPEEVDSITDDSFKLIEDNINNKKVVAVGEIGLDYYWTKDNIEKQKEVLEYQIKIAEKYKKPVVIHSRDAIKDTFDILKKYKVKGVIHCFSSSLEMAREFIKLGFKIGVGGTVTFKNSKKLQDIVKELDLKDIVLETDSPYLTPEPYRGEKNKPSNVYLVALKVAELKNMSVDEVLSVTNKSAIDLFDLIIQK